ncbi:MAG: RNA ligase (ATP), partial [Microbacteriaceae bacterium]|nr:RNA ligase (ATP) [Microbacteriaceae bacterium]
GTKNEREGIVIRSRDGLYSPTLKGRLSFKVLSNRFLLTEKD